MCGIAGYIGHRPLKKENVEKTLPLMKRRGPDAQGNTNVLMKKNEGFVSLLHSRLSIIDLDPRGNQPFKFGSKWIIFNGEIYNYRELRIKLENAGKIFKTNTDTEVLIQALDLWGFQALEMCEGMWSFALYDEIEETLYLSRDRFGEKPLFYYQDDSTGFYFGSEIKFIKSLSDKKFEVNEEHIKRFLVNGYKSLYKKEVCFFIFGRCQPTSDR